MTATVTLTVNTRPVTLTLEPRTHLADALREHLNLTGTHLGCEQGVCGACTVLIDGKPQRSCIAYAVDCDGSEIVTIEGFDADPTMAALREAFSAHHGLQCGFCTPGMLITARDIVLRLGDIPESRIRHELSGNLCRCTGYVGIVDAIKAVMLSLRGGSEATYEAIHAPDRDPGSSPQSHGRPTVAPPRAQPNYPRRPAPTPAPTTPHITDTILLAAPPEAVWAALTDLPALASCLPGAELDSIDGDKITGRVRVALGPIRAAFTGTGTLSLDAQNRQGRLTGGGRDAGSAADGEITWQVRPGETGGSLLAISLNYRLTGPLAQFGRSGLVHDLVRRLAADFARNLDAMIAGRIPPEPRSLNLLSLLWSLVKRKLFNRPGA